MIIQITGMTDESQESIYQRVKGLCIGVIDRKPSFEEVKTLRDLIGRVEVTPEQIGAQLREWLGDGYTTIEKSNIIKEARKIQPRVSNLPKGVQENLYTQLYILIKREREVIQNKGVLIYKGRPDKYELLILDILTNLGVLSILENFTNTEALEQMVQIEIEEITGHLKEPIEYMLKRKQEDDIESKIIVNPEINITTPDILKGILESLDKETTERETSEGKYKVYHVEICGVGEEEHYTRILTEFKEELELNPRVFKIIEQGIVNPSMIENNALDSRSVDKGTIVADIMAKYPVVADKDTIRLVEKAINGEVEAKKITGARMNNYTRVISVWLKRILDKYYTGVAVTELPILVVWGELTEREEKFIEIISVLPMDIVHFAPTQQQKFKFFKTIQYTVGADKAIVGGYPRNTKLYREKTQTFEAKEELNDILYDGSMGLYKQMQFDRVKAKVMRATIEDLGVMWRVPMRFRTPFDTRHGIVEVSNFFVQLNGVPQGVTEEEYKRQIQEYITGDTVILEKVAENPALTSIVRRAVIRDKVDYGMIMKSEAYRYGYYSERTQQTIVEKATELLELDWSVGEIRNLQYTILEVIFNLPTEILQKQHAYTYTEDAPKILFMGNSTDMEGVTLRESIALIFLALCGWDVMVVSPAGYRYTDRYIQSNIVDTIEIGPYNFGIEWQDHDKRALKRVDESVSLFGMIKNIFKK